MHSISRFTMENRLQAIQEQAQKYQFPMQSDIYNQTEVTVALAKCLVELCFSLRQYISEEGEEEHINAKGRLQKKGSCRQENNSKECRR